MRCLASRDRSSRSTCRTRRSGRRSDRSTSCATSPSSPSSGRARAGTRWRSNRWRGHLGQERRRMADRTLEASESAELRRLRRRIDSLDRRIVELLNERAELALEVGRAKRVARRRGVRDLDREREVLLRVSMANTGPTPQADLLAVYRRLMAVARRLETRERRATNGDEDHAG